MDDEKPSAEMKQFFEWLTKAIDHYSKCDWKANLPDPNKLWPANEESKINSIH